jgi:hypothetical protein
MGSFYRVSHLTRRSYGGDYFVGPYSGHHTWEDGDDQCAVDDMGYRHSGSDEHPSPFRDAFDRDDWRNWDNWVCGFDSVDALNNWFAGWFPGLRKCGFIVREYRVDASDIVVGKQALAIVDRCNVRAVRRHKITDQGVFL